jgi:DNA repair protein SbcC/Rad50
MIITQFKIENFGGHKSFGFDSVSRVVGLVGANGAGKSTILEAIKFAITGTTHDDQRSYIRHGTDKAEVFMEFVKDGRAGQLTRTIGKTSGRRQLVWDGKTYKAAKEVDALMASIFGAGKQAIANAVFIRQGMLEQILFSGAADRRDMFIQLVNMDFCASRVRALESRIERLGAEIVDLGPAVDAASTQVRLLEAALVEVARELDVYPDRSDWLQWTRRRLAAQSQYDGLEAQIIATGTDLRVRQIDLDEALKQNGAESLDLLRQSVSRLASELDDEARVLAFNQKVNAGLTQHLQVDTKWREQMQESMQTDVDLAALDKDYYECVGVSMADLNRWCEEQTCRGVLLHDAQKLQDALTEYRTTLSQLKSPGHSSEEIMGWRDELDKLRVRISIFSSHLQQQEELAKCKESKERLQDGSIRCSKCGLRIANPELLDEDALNMARSDLYDLRLDYAERSAEIDRNIKAWEAFRNTKASLETAIKQTEQSQEDVRHRLSKMQDQPSVFALRDRMMTYATRKQQLLYKKQLATQVIAQLRPQREALQQYAAYAGNPVFEMAAVTQFAESVRRAQESFKKTKAGLEAVEQLNMAIVMLTEQIAGLRRRQATASADMVDPKDPHLADLCINSDRTWNSVVAHLESLQQTRNMVLGRVQQAQQALAQANQEHHALIDRQQLDKGKLELIQDLRTLSDLLKPEGLPMAVVDYHFGHLARLTQEALTQLDANFSIIVDSDKPLTFQFIRLDKAESMPLPMDKLSGGQRVRLCLAFLIAVQKRLVKDVGLLVLDEPSTHVDTAGVESLAQLLSNMTQQLQNVETQIVVCDHHEGLRGCFGTEIALPPC